jgi:hypothetical protein
MQGKPAATHSKWLTVEDSRPIVVAELSQPQCWRASLNSLECDCAPVASLLNALCGHSDGGGVADAGVSCPSLFEIAPDIHPTTASAMVTV